MRVKDNENRAGTPWGNVSVSANYWPSADPRSPTRPACWAWSWGTIPMVYPCGTGVADIDLAAGDIVAAPVTREGLGQTR
jgi:hypothetical protein